MLFFARMFFPEKLLVSIFFFKFASENKNSLKSDIKLVKMNKQLIVKVAFSVLFAFGAVYGAVKEYQALNDDTRLNDVLLENVEALTDDEHSTTPTKKCTRATLTAPCYEYVFMGYKPGTTTPIYTYMETHRKITAVEEYVPNGPEECFHDTVTDC